MQALTELDSSIDSASARLQELRSQRDEKSGALQKGRSALQETRASIKSFREQLESSSETLQVCSAAAALAPSGFTPEHAAWTLQGMQQKADLAHAKSAKAWEAMDPRNSKLVKSYFEKA